MAVGGCCWFLLVAAVVVDCQCMVAVVVAGCCSCWLLLVAIGSGTQTRELYVVPRRLLQRRSQNVVKSMGERVRDTKQ